MNSGTFIKYQVWKKIVNNAVLTVMQEQWCVRMSTDPDLKHFRQIHPLLNSHFAWTVAKKCPALKYACTNVVKMAACWRPGKVKGSCNKCTRDFDDFLIHRVCDCSETEQFRDHLWTDIINCSPVEVSVSLHSRNDMDLVCSLLSCRPPIQIAEEDELQYAITVIRHVSTLIDTTYA